MDEYNQIGPGKGDYQDDIKTIAALLTSGPVFVRLAAVGTGHHLMLMTCGTQWNFATAPAGIGPYIKDETTDMSPLAYRLAHNDFILVGRDNGTRPWMRWFDMKSFHEPAWLGTTVDTSWIDALALSAFLHRLAFATGMLSLDGYAQARAASYDAYKNYMAQLPHAPKGFTDDGRFTEATGWDFAR